MIPPALTGRTVRRGTRFPGGVRLHVTEAAETADGPLTEDLAVTLLADGEARRTEFRGFEEGYRED